MEIKIFLGSIDNVEKGFREWHVKNPGISILEHKVQFSEREQNEKTICVAVIYVPEEKKERIEIEALTAVFSGIVDGNLSIRYWSRRVEKQLISRALKETGGNRTRAAKILEISHRALLYKIKEYGLN